MSQYLQVRVEGIAVLLPALQVHEVLGLEGMVMQSEAHVAWREQIIALMDLGAVLDRPRSTQRTHGVVYSLGDSAEPPVMLQVDEVLGLRTPQAADWRPLPQLPSQAQVWLDGIWLEPPDQRHAYRLRHPVLLDPCHPQAHFCHPRA